MNEDIKKFSRNDDAEVCFTLKVAETFEKFEPEFYGVLKLPELNVRFSLHDCLTRD